MSQNIIRSRALPLLLVCITALVLALATHPASARAEEQVTANAATTFTSMRYSGESRYATACNIVLATYGQEGVVAAGTTHAILSCASNYPDALAATAYAGIIDAPIILTETNQLSREAAVALLTLGITQVTIVGGEGAIDNYIAEQLTALGITVNERLYGESRYSTAYKIYEAGKGKWGDTAIIATGGSFPDALSISPYANAAKAPVFLAGPDGMLDEDSLTAVKAFENIIIVGGAGVVSEDLEDELATAGLSVVRLFGVNRYETSVNIANWLIENAGFTWDDTAFATGGNFPDALAGSIMQGRSKSPLLLIDKGVSETLACARDVMSGQDVRARILGGTGVVTVDVVEELAAFWDEALDEGAWEYPGTLARITVATWQRFSGASRYDTMRNLVLATYGKGGASETEPTQALLVCGEDFPDALAAAAYAGLIDAPIVMTEGDKLSDAALSTLLMLKVKEVTIIGGTGVVTADVANTLTQRGFTVTERLSGTSRYETAFAVYKKGVGSWGDTVIVATGGDFPDALSISPYANAAKAPILLVGTNGTLVPGALEAIKTFKNVIIVGGTGVIPSSFEGLFDGQNVIRLSGANAYDTSAKIARWLVGLEPELSVQPDKDTLFAWEDVAFATRTNYPDALAGAVLQGHLQAPLLLVDNTDAAQGVFDLIGEECRRTDISMSFLGGEGALTQEAANRILAHWVLFYGAEWEYEGNIISPTPYGKIVDMSYYNTVNDWATFAKNTALAILRVQDPIREESGKNRLDPMYYEFAENCEANDIPYGVYAFCRYYDSVATAQAEATTFYNLAIAGGHDPSFFILDVEGTGYSVEATNAFVAKLRSFGVEKVGIYIGAHVYTTLGLDMTKFDFVWIPSYGKNDGTLVNAKEPEFPYDMWQFTSLGSLDGLKTPPCDLSILNLNGPNMRDYYWYIQ